MMAAAVIAHTSAILNSSVALYSMDFHEKFIRPIAKPWGIAAITSVVLTITSILMVPVFQNAESIINLLQQLNGLFSMPILSAFIAGLLFRNVDARAAIGGLIWGLGSYAVHNFILYVPNDAFGGQTYYQHMGLPWLHYIDVMVIVLITSVMVALAVNRFIFGNRATFIFSAEGREMRRAENAALDAAEARA
jgi:SSS family solute:Na+ symporter